MNKCMLTLDKLNGCLRLHTGIGKENGNVRKTLQQQDKGNDKN